MSHAGSLTTRRSPIRFTISYLRIVAKSHKANHHKMDGLWRTFIDLLSNAGAVSRIATWVQSQQLRGRRLERGHSASPIQIAIMPFAGKEAKVYIHSESLIVYRVLTNLTSYTLLLVKLGNESCGSEKLEKSGNPNPPLDDEALAPARFSISYPPPASTLSNIWTWNTAWTAQNNTAVVSAPITMLAIPVASIITNTKIAPNVIRRPITVS
mmetsp:Transcript_11597/g.19872  ORF Transcript_11597/g.19872 Transcript_11597/m.19872 type:complete len:211 (-) Transcript_11597:695-1327(-)